VIDELLQSTPLRWAIRWERYELAQLYLDRGADPELAGADWATPLAWADKKSNPNLTNLIQRYL
jgi:ankyrin repeat protein